MPTEIDSQYEVKKKDKRFVKQYAGEENLRHTNTHKLLNGNGTNNEAILRQKRPICLRTNKIRIKTTY